MPKRKSPVMDNSTARDIFNELEAYAKDKQFYPIQNALFSYMTRFIVSEKTGEREHCYKLTRGMFNHWFDRLVEEGYIQIDRETRSIRAVNLEIREKEDHREKLLPR